MAGAVSEQPEAERQTLRIVDSEGVEREIDLSEVGFDFGALAAAAMQGGGGGERQDDKPSWEDVSKGFEKVRSTADGDSFYGVWVNRQTNQMLAELPRGFQNQKHFFAMTVAGGEIFAGLQLGDYYVYWKQYGDDRLALVAPQISVRSSGEQGSRDSVERIFRDRVILDVPILTRGPSGQPVIDMDDMLVGQASKFFGRRAAGLQRQLSEISKAKAFPQNVELAFDVPDRNGTIKTFHYSISLIRGTPGYQTREADTRVGYFTTSYRDLGKVKRDEVARRYINRWHLEKAEPSLKMSPPKEPIVFYVEHTTPVRYRRWVRKGAEYWNDAFREIGIDGAIEVRFQDKQTGAHMEKDPEDVRFNFIRWLNNDISTAIGPSRVNPMTGEILDADVILTDGWLRVFTYRWNDLLPDLAMENFGPETLEWLEQRPDWDPRVRMAAPTEREQVVADIRAKRGVQRFGGHPAANLDPSLLGDDEYDGLIGRVSQVNGMCRAATGKAMQLGTAMMHLATLGDLADVVFGDPRGMDPDEIPPEMLERLKKQLEENPDLLEMLPPELRKKLEAALEAEKAEPDEETSEEQEASEEDKADEETDSEWAGDKIDGIPEAFVGPMLAELVAHEVGHTIGLRHNFKASSAYELEEINSPEFKGQKPWSASVMDYNGINIRMPLPDGESGEIQGDFSSIDIGPYDLWAIEFGYGFGKRDEVLARSTEPELDYATDEDTFGPDPLARRYDLSKYPLDWCRNQMALVGHLRDNLLDKYVEDGESWAQARQGFNIALGQHFQAVAAMANWIGGMHVYRDKKGNPDGRAPIDPVSAKRQRESLEFVIENTFFDEAFGLNSKILRHMTIDKWYGAGGSVGGSIFEDNNVPVHDQVLGVQSTTMTMLLNPTTLRRVHDQRYFFENGEEAFTLAELLRSVSDAAWEELRAGSADNGLEISTLRQNLQREHVERLIDLTMPGAVRGAAAKPIASLATMHLREVAGEINDRLSDRRARMGDEVKAHLEEIAARIEQALDAEYIYNTDDLSGGGAMTIIFGRDAEENSR